MKAFSSYGMSFVIDTDRHVVLKRALNQAKEMILK